MWCCTICTKTLKRKWYITSYKEKNIVLVHTILQMTICIKKRAYMWKYLAIKMFNAPCYMTHCRYAFVKFPQKSQADDFISKYSDYNYHGRNLIVRYSNPGPPPNYKQGRWITFIVWSSNPGPLSNCKLCRWIKLIVRYSNPTPTKLQRSTGR